MLERDCGNRPANFTVDFGYKAPFRAGFHEPLPIISSLVPAGNLLQSQRRRQVECRHVTDFHAGERLDCK